VGRKKKKGVELEADERCRSDRKEGEELREENGKGRGEG